MWQKLFMVWCIVSVQLVHNNMQAAPLPDAGRLLQQEQPLLNTPLSPQSLNSLSEPSQSDKRSNTKLPSNHNGALRFIVPNFIFSGNTLFSHEELTALMSGSINKSITIDELHQALNAITAAYRQKGYLLASVFLPPQTVQIGSPIRIQIVEGLLEKVTIAQRNKNPRTRTSLLDYYAGQLPLNKPLNNNELAELVMRMNELPNISSRILLEPGSRPGTTQATLQITEGEPLHYAVQLDNYGNESTGINRFSVSMDAASPLQLGDQLMVKLQTSTTGELRNFHSSYSLPITPYGSRLKVSYYYVGYQTSGAFSALQVNGTAQNIQISLNHPLWRSQQGALNTTIASETNYLNDRLESLNTANQRMSNSYQLGVNGVIVDALLGGGYTSFSVGAITGNLSINDPTQLYDDQSPYGLHTNGRYSKYTLSLSRTQHLGKGWSFYAGTYGQQAGKNLSSFEQLTLGGAGAVRAWESTEAYGDSGMIATAEIRHRLQGIEEFPGNVELFAFIDYATATLHTNPLANSGKNQQTLSGAGIGIKWFDAGNFHIQTTAAWKLGNHYATTTPPMIYAQAVKMF